MITPKTPIIEALKELKFSRPAWTQKLLDEFIEEADRRCFKFEGDGTFNHIIDEVFDKE